MNAKALQQVEQLLTEAAKSRTWGMVEIDIRDGKPTLIRTMRQIKLTPDEETPANARFNR